MISICIPCYEMHNRGVEFLEYSFQKFETQTFKDFDVVIGDHSVDDRLKDLCAKWSDKLDIKYYRNEENRGNAASNTDFTIRKATGKWIKILLEDDFLFDENSLQDIAINLDADTMWVVTPYVHTRGDRSELLRPHYPIINQFLMVNNTLGTPSGLTIRNMHDLPEFDNNLSYCYDCDWYWRLYQKYNEPKLLINLGVVIYLWENSITSHVSQKLIKKESEYILKKYGLIN